MFYCCVPFCTSKGDTVSMHRFPKDEELCGTWLQLLNVERLYGIPMKDLRRSYRVCDNHFNDEARIINGKGRRGSTIRADAVPSLYLPNEEDKENRIPVEPSPSTSSAFDESVGFLTRESKSPSLPDVDQSLPHPKCQSVGRGGQILKRIGMKKVQDLSPKSKVLYKYAVKLREKSKREHLKLMSTKDRLKKAVQLSKSPEFMKAKVNKQTFNFLLSQLKLQKIAPRGRRFSLEDKIFALSIQKQSPRGYRLLSKIFALPSRRTLSNFLHQIPFKTGINEHIFSALQKTCNSLDAKDKYCSVVFDEMALEPGLYYSSSDDFIEGFQDNGCERKPVFADKAMVFMARGIYKKWKQPLAYYFNGGGMKTDVLIQSLKDVIRRTRQAGFKVICTVCDQGTTNRSAIKYLYKETESEYARKNQEKRTFGFEIDEEEVVPLYDVPHLLKCIRNLLFDNVITYKWRNGENKMAQWKHIRKMYELEDPAMEYRLCHKLTDAHIDNTKKMKVSMAAQVLSCRVAAAIKVMSRLGGDTVEPDAVDTAEFIVFIDKTFDSLNGSRITAKGGKTLRTAATKKSDHLEHWKEAIQVFLSMKCSNSKRKNFTPPTIGNWVHTLKAFRYLTTKLFNSGFTFVCTRNFNQDPLENFFGSIRSHGIRNVNPDCHSFKNSFKSLIINNFMTPSSQNKNCEEDNLSGLNNLRDFFSEVIEVVSDPVEVSLLENPPLRTFESGLLTYIAGYIVKQVVKKVKCKLCRTELIGKRSELSEASVSIINARAYSSNALLCPNTIFNTVFHRTVDILTNYVPVVCHKSDIVLNLKCNLQASEEFKNRFTCELHDLLSILFDYICKFHVNTWVKNVNKILRGKDTSNQYQDPIKILAHKKYLKHKGAASKVRAMKNIK